jgi:hypothetical protein
MKQAKGKFWQSLVVINRSEPEGNSFNILAQGKLLMQMLGKDEEVIKQMLSEAQSGDYEHLIEIVISYTDGLLEVK